MHQESLPFPSLLTVKDFCLKHSAFSEGSIRYLIFRSSDGFDSDGSRKAGNGLIQFGAIVRIGRRVLIDEQAFFRWIRNKENDGVTDDPAGSDH